MSWRCQFCSDTVFVNDRVSCLHQARAVNDIGLWHGKVSDYSDRKYFTLWSAQREARKLSSLNICVDPN